MVWWKKRPDEQAMVSPPRQRRIDIHGTPGLTAPVIRSVPSAGMLSTGFTYGGELTITSGLVTRTAILHDIDTESDAASDALVGAYGGIEGAALTIWANHTDRTIVIHHAESGGESVDGTRFILAGSADVSLTATGLAMSFVYVTALDSAKGAWQETARGTGLDDHAAHAALDTGIHGAGPDILATDADITTHTGVAAAHHARYTDTEARTAVPFAIYIPFGTGPETFLP